MKRRTRAFAQTMIAAIYLAAALAVPACAQGRGGPPSGGMGEPRLAGSQYPGPGGGMGEAAPGSLGMGGDRSQPRSQSSESHSGLAFGPPGRWWDDHGFAKSLKLRPEQQMKMDTIFEQNRSALITSLEGVRQAQAQMDQLSRAASPDEAALFAQIDRVAQARAELEKTTTHLLLQIRSEMDPDQIKRLQQASQR